MLKDFLIWFERSDGTRGYATFTENKEIEARSSFFACYRHDVYKILSVEEVT